MTKQQLTLSKLHYVINGKEQQLLRPRRGKVPHLTSYRLRYILEKNSIEHDFLDLEDIWSIEGFGKGYDVVAVSTTFICHFPTLKKVVSWILERNSDPVIILGGQYTNLKYEKFMSVNKHNLLAYVKSFQFVS